MCEKKQDKDVPVAYHEAGHMIVAYMLGADLCSVSISPNQSIYYLNKTDYLGKGTALMAGGEAEERVPGNNSRSMLDRTEDDWKKTYKAAEESGLSGQEQIFQFIENSIDAANQIVVQQWKAIDALAQKLLETRHMDKESVLEIITPLIAPTA